MYVSVYIHIYIYILYIIYYIYIYFYINILHTSLPSPVLPPTPPREGDPTPPVVPCGLAWAGMQRHKQGVFPPPPCGVGGVGGWLASNSSSICNVNSVYSVSSVYSASRIDSVYSIRSVDSVY